MYYNRNLKIEFKNYLIENNKNYHMLFNRIFISSAKLEEEFSKDLYSFNRDELLKFYKSLAEEIKLATIINYNFLIKEYKRYCLDKKLSNVVIENIESKEIKEIKCKKNYNILNDVDIFNIYSMEIKNTEHNAIIFIGLMWEMDARVKPEDILKVKIDNFGKNRTVQINGNEYNISEKLEELILDFAEMDEIITPKRGRFDIVPAKENGGYIFRKIKTAKTKIGEPMTLPTMDNLLNKWSNEYFRESISINDIKMSLALKYMLLNFKTHTEMFTESRYFQKIQSYVYQNMFNEFARVKYPKYYNDYVEYFVEIMEKLNYFV